MGLFRDGLLISEKAMMRGAMFFLDARFAQSHYAVTIDRFIGDTWWGKDWKIIPARWGFSKGNKKIMPDSWDSFEGNRQVADGYRKDDVLDTVSCLWTMSLFGYLSECHECVVYCPLSSIPDIWLESNNRSSLRCGWNNVFYGIASWSPVCEEKSGGFTWGNEYRSCSCQVV